MPGIYRADIAEAAPSMTYAATPTLDGASLNVKIAKFEGQYTVSVTGLVRTSLVPGLPYIAGTDLPAGTKWWVLYELTMGSVDSTSNVEAFVSTGLGGSPNVERSWARGSAECNGGPTGAEAMNGSHMSGMFVMTSDGTALEFTLHSIVGSSKPVYFTGMQLIAVQIDTLTENTNYFYGSYSPDYFGSTADIGITNAAGPSFLPVLSKTFTIPAAGDYLLWCSVQGRSLNTVGDSIQVRVKENGIELPVPRWIKSTADTRDRHPANFALVRSYIAGSLTIDLEGNTTDASNTREFHQPRIFILRLGSFQKYSYTTAAPSPVSITTFYPAFEEASAVSLTPYQTVTGEYVLSIGNCWVNRSDFASILARTANATTEEVLHDYCSNANTTALASDQATLISFSAQLANALNRYSFRVAAESVFGGGPYYRNVTQCVIGLTKVSVPGTTFQLPLDDAAGSGDDSGSTFVLSTGGTQGDLGLGDLGSGADDILFQIIPAPTNSIPDVHPRLWIYNNDRLANWVSQAIANTAAWQLLISTRGLRDQGFANAMAYLANGSTTYRDAAIQKIDDNLNNEPAPGYGWKQYSGLIMRDYLRDFACTYDWMYNELGATRRQRMEDFMGTLVFMEYNQDDPYTLAIYDNMFGEGATNPLQNYSSAFLLAAVYYALVMYHHQPTTIGWPPGSTTNRVQFHLPFGTMDYTDPFEFVKAKLAAWLPEWQTHADGGGWHEGSNYGRAAIRHQIEMCHLLKYTAGSLYLDQYPYLKQVLLYELYAEQPGHSRLISLGDEDTSVDDYSLHMMLLGTDGFQGTPEAEYGQYYNTNDVPMQSSGGIAIMKCMPFLLYRSGRQSTDYKTILPTHYYAPGTGFVNSRSAWGSSGVSVTFTSQDMIRNHMHKDQNQIQIFHGVASGGVDGWVLCDASVFSGIGTARASEYHNTYMVWTPDGPTGNSGWWSQRSGDVNSPAGQPTGRVDRQIETSTYSYVQGNCNDAYYTVKLQSGVQPHSATNYNKINDIFLREFVHLKTLDFVVAYDRFRFVSTYPTGLARSRWHYPKVVSSPPADMGGGIVMNTNAGASRIFRKYLVPTSGLSPTFTDENTDLGTNTWREDLLVPTTALYGKLLTCFQVRTAPGAVMTPTQAVVSGGSYYFDGVTIRDTTNWYHVVFSASQDGSTPATIRYSVEKNNDNDKHLVCNLVPNQNYQVAQANVAGSFYQYTLTTTLEFGFVANAAGIVEFTPSQLAGQGGFPLDLSDVAGSGVDDFSTQMTANPVFSDSGTGDDAGSYFVVIPGGSGTVVDLFMSDAGGSGEDSFQFSQTLNLDDGGGGVDDIGLEIIPLRPGFTEKAISSLAANLFPSSDLGAGFCVPEPNDNVFYDKLNQTDDGTFIRFVGTLAFYFGYAQFGIEDPSAFVGTIHQIRIRARIREADVAGSTAPILAVTVGAEGMPPTFSYAQANLSLSSTIGSVIEVASFPLSVLITPDQMRSVTLILRPRATTVIGEPSVSVSACWIEILSADSTEKVIE